MPRPPAERLAISSVESACNKIRSPFILMYLWFELVVVGAVYLGQGLIDQRQALRHPTRPATPVGQPGRDRLRVQSWTPIATRSAMV